MPTKTQLPWTDIRKRVVKLLCTLTVTTEKRIGGSITKEERPMRFREFSTQLGFDNGQVHHAIRNGKTPSAPLEAAVREWVIKQEK